MRDGGCGAISNIAENVLSSLLIIVPCAWALLWVFSSHEEA